MRLLLSVAFALAFGLVMPAAARAPSTCAAKPTGWPAPACLPGAPVCPAAPPGNPRADCYNGVHLAVTSPSTILERPSTTSGRSGVTNRVFLRGTNIGLSDLEIRPVHLNGGSTAGIHVNRLVGFEQSCLPPGCVALTIVLPQETSTSDNAVRIATPGGANQAVWRYDVRTQAGTKARPIPIPGCSYGPGVPIPTSPPYC